MEGESDSKEERRMRICFFALAIFTIVFIFVFSTLCLGIFKLYLGFSEHLRTVIYLLLLIFETPQPLFSKYLCFLSPPGISMYDSLILSHSF